MLANFTKEQIDRFGSILNDTNASRTDSALLKHELAYCLGQTQNKTAIPILIDVLRDHKQEPIVRHEAAEALGAIGDSSAETILLEHRKDPCQEVAETCELALRRLQWIKE
ncbi:Dohh-1p, partial [Parelaphostrongylus tenuis]